MTDTIETTARQIVEKIQRDLFRSDIHPSEARKEHIAAIAAALEAERLEEREACAEICESIDFLPPDDADNPIFSMVVESSSRNTGAYLAAAIRSRSTST
jgi:hypothetical protein